MKQAFLSLVALALSLQVFAQLSRTDITNGNEDVTWIGVDFTQLKFVGNATQWQDAGEITNAQLRDKYFPAWNNLFVTEQKKYNVADAVGRADVKYALEVTERANNSVKGNFFSDDPNEFNHLTKEKLESLVAKYDFRGNKGLGMLFFVESFSKGREAGNIWVTFVDMNTKKVLLTQKLTEQAGGIGFKNFWAKTLYGALKDTRKDLKKWTKG